MNLPSRLDDRYEVREILGRGGMGIVYKAYDSQRRGYVALKTMKDAADPASLKLFAQEWRTLANISHPNIVDIFDSGEFEEDRQRKPYFVMPLLPGKTLDNLIRDASHRLTPERAVDILVQTCRGLQAAHDHGLLHRDLKPSNLFILNDDAVKIIDFGMVHLLDVKNTQTSLKGTLQYMAPEQLEMKELTAATDIFSLGVVAYEALTGRKPFDRGTEGATAQAIRNEFPPPASDLNPAVNKAVGQVVAKAMAKGPWNRFTSAREFGEYLHKAVKREEIELFDVVRIQPRVERARRALGEGDLEYANEILNDLQSEGRVDSEITRLLEEVRQATQSKLVRQLLDSARMRLQEMEFPLAWQKVQEVLQKDPENAEAQALQAEIETSRSDQQTEKWRRLVQQHLHNHAFTQARQAIEEIRKLRRDEADVAELIAEADRREKEFVRGCEEKERQFQSAMHAYSNGEISTALSKLQKILDPASRTNEFVVPARDEIYRETYNRIRTEWETVQYAIAEVEKVMATGNLERAAEMVRAQSEKYLNDFGLQALKLNVDDQIRQEKSAYIAEIGRRVESEADLDRAVKFLEEALERYPNEPHLNDLAASLRKRRDLVESIVTKAHQYEEQNQVGEALGQWKTLRSIYHQYPGLEFEIQRVQAGLERQKREEAKLSWVDQIDRLLQSHDYDRAHALAQEALHEFSGDPELLSLSQLAVSGRERGQGALLLMQQGQRLGGEHRFPEAIDLLRRAVELDPNNVTVRNEMASALASQAKVLIADDWRAAEPLIQEALRVAPANALAKSLRPSVLLAKRTEFIDKCVAQARELQAAGNLNGALNTVQEGLASYPNDGRLVQLQNALRNTIAEQGVAQRRRDLEELKQLSREAEAVRDETTLTALFERSTVLSGSHPNDAAFLRVASDIEERTKIFQTTPDSRFAPARDTPDEPVRRKGSEQFGRFTSQLKSLWAKAASLPARIDWKPILGWVQEQGGAVSWTQRGGVALVLILALASVSSGRKPATSIAPGAPQPVSVTFEVTPPDSDLVVDGRPTKGASAGLTPGLHQVAATKPGYKPWGKPVLVTATRNRFQIQLVPEPHVIRISAALPAAKVLLDNAEIGSLQEGNFSADAPPGRHTLRLVAATGDVFSLKLQLDDGAAAKVLELPAAREVPVVLVSTLGSHGLVQSSLPEMRVKVQDGALQSIPPGGRDLGVVAANSQLTFDDGKKALTVPVEMSNAPVLSIVAGSVNKGTLLVDTLDGASVYINGTRNRRTVQHGKWIGQLDPGEYTIRVGLDGYDAPAEQKLTIVGGKSNTLKFTLNPTVTVAFLRVEGGTPDAEVLIDGTGVGKLDSSGSLAAQSIAPDTEHAIRIRKENYESYEARRQAGVKETILISGAEAQLKAFATVVFDVQPSDAAITIRRPGEALRDVPDKTMHLRAGNYIVNATADGYEPLQREEQVNWGQTRTVRLALSRKALTVVPVKQVALNDLFVDTKDWTQQGDFWIHDGTDWLKEIHFSHIFDVLKPKKKMISQGKVSWRIFLNREDYIECQLDDKAFYRREKIGGKFGPQTKLLHDAGDGNAIRIEMTIAADRVTHKIGQVNDTFPCEVAGRTGFDGKFGLRLVK